MNKSVTGRVNKTHQEQLHFSLLLTCTWERKVKYIFVRSSIILIKLDCPLFLLNMLLFDLVKVYYVWFEWSINLQFFLLAFVFIKLDFILF